MHSRESTLLVGRAGPASRVRPANSSRSAAPSGIAVRITIGDFAPLLVFFHRRESALQLLDRPHPICFEHGVMHVPEAALWG